MRGKRTESFLTHRTASGRGSTPTGAKGATTPVSPMPGRRRVYMGGAGENSATGTEDMLVPNKQVQKVIENGQLIIIRDGVKYNVQGVRL